MIAASTRGRRNVKGAKIKKAKYRSITMEVNGISFPSRKEARRYQQLLLLEKAGQITALELQPRFELMPKFRYQGRAVRKMEYVADFRYLKDGTVVIEDVKGVKTEAYMLKAKLFIHQYASPNGWDFWEV